MANSFSSLSQLAARYAGALFTLALEKGTLDEINDNLKTIDKAIEQSEQLQTFIASPLIKGETRRKVMRDLLEKMGSAKTTQNFIGVLIKNSRLFVLPAIIKAFMTELSLYNNEVRVEVFSARTLTKAQLEKLEKQLKTVTESKIIIDATVDKSLLGGLIVKIGSRMIDSSLKTKISTLRLALTSSDVTAKTL